MVTDAELSEARPVVVSVLSVVSPVTPSVPATVWLPVTPRLPPTVALFVTASEPVLVAPVLLIVLLLRTPIAAVLTPLSTATREARRAVAQGSAGDRPRGGDVGCAGDGARAAEVEPARRIDRHGRLHELSGRRDADEIVAGRGRRIVHAGREPGVGARAEHDLIGLRGRGARADAPSRRKTPIQPRDRAP